MGKTDLLLPGYIDSKIKELNETKDLFIVMDSNEFEEQVLSSLKWILGLQTDLLMLKDNIPNKTYQDNLKIA